MLASGLVLALLASDPQQSTAVLLARRTALPGPEAGTLLKQCGDLLTALHLPGILPGAETARALSRLNLKDATSCKGRLPCVAELGRQLKVDWVVMVSLSQLGDERSIGLELLQVSTESVVERDAVMLAARARPTAELLEAFAQRASRVISPQPTTSPAPDVPPVVSLTPEASPVVDALPPPPPPPPPARTHTASFVLGSAGVAMLASAAVLLGVGLSTRAELAGTNVDGRLRSPLTYTQAQDKLTVSAIELGAAGACGALGLALGSAAVLTW